MTQPIIVKFLDLVDIDKNLIYNFFNDVNSIETMILLRFSEGQLVLETPPKQ